MSILHGVKDAVVPATSAMGFHQTLNHGRIAILPTVEHAETVLQLRMGGETQDAAIAWLEEQHNQ
jgi:hypothetical protein